MRGEKSISIKMQLNGRLGNQLFLWAYAHELWDVYNVPVRPFSDKFHFPIGNPTVFDDAAMLCPGVLPQTRSDFSGFVLKSLDKIASQNSSTAATIENLLKIQRQKDAYELPELKSKPNMVTGYYINASMVSRNSAHLLEHLKHKFTELPKLNDEYRDLLTMEYEAIHIRRGDYTKLSNTFGLLDSSWYERNLRRKKPLVVATDDLPGSSEVIKALSPEYILDPSKVSPWQTMSILGSARRLIMANSTFSWWAGYIGSHNGAEVVFPSPFYKSEPWRNRVLEFESCLPANSSFE
jgi:hypothetical protein